MPQNGELWGEFPIFLSHSWENLIFVARLISLHTMIEIPPSLQNIEEKAINLLTDPLCQDILAHIDHDYLYWDKVKYLAPQSM